MDINTIKLRAFEMKNKGMSYRQIARQLQIGRTTAYDYVKEVSVQQGGKLLAIPPICPEPASELGRTNVPDNPTYEQKDIPKSLIEIKKVKEFTGDELVKKKFDFLEFNGRFLELIGQPSKIFSGMIWGLPKGGKSNFSIRFADYLQEWFGDVVYIAAEEGESVTLQKKIQEIGGSKVTFVENRDRDSIRQYLPVKTCDFVFIDSINNAGIDSDLLEIIKRENPLKSFITIVQATKGGDFKGDQSLTHNCDFIIKVIKGVAYQEGRFNPNSEIKIFDEPLYEKNPIGRKDTTKDKIKDKQEPLQNESDGNNKDSIIPISSNDEIKIPIRDLSWLPTPKTKINIMEDPEIKRIIEKANVKRSALKPVHKPSRMSSNQKSSGNNLLFYIAVITGSAVVISTLAGNKENKIQTKKKL